VTAGPSPSAEQPAAAEAPPLTVIERRPGWHLIDLAELWRGRELLTFLVWRDIKVRYKQTVLGAAWAILQPMAMMIAFTLFLGPGLGAVPDSSTPYPLFVFAGLLPWFFLANSVTSAGQSVVGGQNLITKVYFPRLFIPLGAVGVTLFDFAVAFGMLAVMMVFYEVQPTWQLFLAPVMFGFLFLAAVGLGVLLAALTVSYRDFRFVIPFLVQLWMFTTPAIYMPVDPRFGPRGQLVLALNPAHGLIGAFRQTVLGGPIDFAEVALSAAISVALLLVGCFYFRRVERGFADII
jgi:lipopolysaccharide transport system permease protein